ncbi:AAA family ATPase [Tamlana sp. 2201CG12-4]|uniref:AAA family ATPase n=1 Tax=Tamlana sp. 2201CG12-4 TaxID=3112582 RepID=UPI002DBB5421|nr:AAA family ATPase [Tamlana sp. 2201CG12-4]MEC3906523.1 AAA family ATPase [Tamlana sp. 2201CG12-4]
MAKIIAITNLKGGVGKTTTAINLSASLGVLEQRVLLIDADPQSNTTMGLGMENIEYGLYQWLANLCKHQQCIYGNESLYFDVIPTTIDLSKLEVDHKNNLRDSYYLIKEKLSSIEQNYDYIIIDSPPSLGSILLNILAACHSVLVTVQCEYFAFQGLNKLFTVLKSIQKDINPEIDIEGILITLYNKSIREHKHIFETIFEHFEQLTLKTKIPQNIKLAEAAAFGKPIIEYDANSSGAISYLNLANEIYVNNTMIVKEAYSATNKTFLKVIEEDIIEDLDFILNIDKRLNANNRGIQTKNYDGLINLSKNEVKIKLGQVYNDMNSDVWMYRISKKFSFLKKNFLYVHFENNKVVSFSLKKFKVS